MVDDGSTGITAVFVPDWGKGNPYQRELAKYLADCRVSVELGDSFKTVFHRIIFSRFRPDIIHLHWLPMFNWAPLQFARVLAFLARLSMMRILGFKIVWTVHNIVPHESPHPRIDRRIGWIVARLARSIIVHSPAAQQAITTTWHLAERPAVFVVPHGNYIGCYEDRLSRSEARQRLAIADGRLVMLFLGSVRPYKGILELIAAFKTVADEQAHLVIAGRPLNDEFSRRISEATAVQTNIAYKPGFVPDDEIQVYMNACDVVVLPYLKTLTSGAAVLAMSFGRPCIAPALGCIRDVLDDRGAFLFDPMDEAGLANALRQAMERRKELDEMGRHNKKRAEEWSWDKVAARTAQVYEQSLH